MSEDGTKIRRGQGRAGQDRERLHRLYFNISRRMRMRVIVIARVI